MSNLLKEINDYVNELTLKESFNNLSIEIEEVSCPIRGKGQFGIKSNSRIGIKNSLQAELEIKKVLSEKASKYRDLESADYVVTFHNKVMDDNKTKKSVMNENISMFYSEMPKYSLEDVILSNETLEDVQNALSMIENHDLIYNQWGWKEKEPAAKTILCFYGAPGTGKTMCAHGIAKHLNKQILIASYADIQSEYVGVGPKNLKAVFDQAEKDNAVLFFDEADSFLRKRTSDTTSSASMHYNSMTNEMMKHLEDFNGLVIFATNLTENTDDAFKTRITCSVEFPLPDEESRVKIISYMIPKSIPVFNPLTNEDYLKIAKTCDGFAGRDIRNAVKSVLTEGARNKSYPFSCESFVSGFERYKDSKDKFTNSINGKKRNSISPLDLYAENNCLLALFTYSAWYDGEENDEESQELKNKAKILGRNKQVIARISDLPSLDEICEGIKSIKNRQIALQYVVDILSLSGDDDKNIGFLKDLVSRLSFNSENVDNICNYYRIVKKKNLVFQTIKEVSEKEECNV